MAYRWMAFAVEQAGGGAVEGRRSQLPKPRRWGLRTLAYLGLAAASILTANILHARGGNDIALLTFLGTVVGLTGAMVCSIRGIRSWNSRPPGS